MHVQCKEQQRKVEDETNGKYDMQRKKTIQSHHSTRLENTEHNVTEKTQGGHWRPRSHDLIKRL